MGNSLSALTETLRPYLVILGAHLRSQASYTLLFGAGTLATLLFTVLEIAEYSVYYYRVPTLGGVDFVGILLIFGLAGVAFSLADLLVGHIDGICFMIRRGELEVFYVRPLSLFAQLATSDLALRRLGRSVSSAVVLAYALFRVPRVDPLDYLLVVVAIVSGVVIFMGLFAMAASLQFFLVDAPETVNTLTYATNYSAQLPTPIFPGPLRWVYLTVLPAAFIGYLPAMHILDQPSLLGVDTWVAWCSPLLAVTTSLTAAVLWAFGTRHYEGAGG